MRSSELDRIGLGTAVIGRPSYINLNTKNTESFENVEKFKKRGVNFLIEAAKYGITHFDTSAGYGIAEDMLLEFLSKSEYRNISVSSKWGYTYTANFEFNPKSHEIKEHSISKLNEQWEKTKLLLPNLNLYQIHSATPDSHVLDNMEVLKRLYELKKEFEIDIGLSTSGLSQNEIIEKALHIKINNESLFTSFQVTFNILEQSLVELKDKLINKKLIIKEALANGRLFSNNYYPHYSNMYEELDSMADKYNVGSDAIALRFCLDIFEDSMVLSGANNTDQLSQNLKAADFKLLPIEIEKLKSFAVNIDEYWNERKLLEWN